MGETPLSVFGIKGLGKHFQTDARFKLVFLSFRKSLLLIWGVKFETRQSLIVLHTEYPPTQPRSMGNAECSATQEYIRPKRSKPGYRKWLLMKMLTSISLTFLHPQEKGNILVYLRDGL